MIPKPYEIFKQSWQQAMVVAFAIAAFGFASIRIGQQLIVHWTVIPLWVFPFIILAILFSLILMGIFLLYFFKAIRTKYAFYENDAIFTIPNWKGFLPLLPYRKLHLSYDEIITVERRREIYSLKGNPLFNPYVTSIFTADNEQQTIRYDPLFRLFKRLDENFAYQLARKSGRPLADQGTVGPRALRDMMLKGAVPWTDEPIAPQNLRVIKRKIRRNQFIGICLLASLYLLVFSYL